MYGSWKTATIALNAKLSDVVDLEGLYKYATIIMTDLTTDSGAAVQVSDKSAGTFVNLYGLYLATPGDIAVPKSKASVVQINGAQFLKISCASDQGAERKILIRGGD